MTCARCGGSLAAPAPVPFRRRDGAEATALLPLHEECLALLVLAEGANVGALAKELTFLDQLGMLDEALVQVVGRESDSPGAVMASGPNSRAGPLGARVRQRRRLRRVLDSVALPTHRRTAPERRR